MIATQSHESSYMYLHVPYSGNFSLVQNCAEKCTDSSEEIFAVYIFAERMRDGLITPLPVDGPVPHAN